MKSIELEFEPGQECHQMIGSKPVVTRIRAYEAKGSVELSSDSKGEQKTEMIKETVMYSTVARPNDPVPAGKLGATKEELIQKLFGHVSSGDSKLNKSKSDKEPAS